MDRFDLEDAMSALHGMGDDIDVILHSYMDAKVRPTEDDMANMLIGAKALHNARYQRMFQIPEVTFSETRSNLERTFDAYSWTRKVNMLKLNIHFLGMLIICTQISKLKKPISIK